MLHTIYEHDWILHARSPLSFQMFFLADKFHVQKKTQLIFAAFLVMIILHRSYFLCQFSISYFVSGSLKLHVFFSPIFSLSLLQSPFLHKSASYLITLHELLLLLQSSSFSSNFKLLFSLLPYFTLTPNSPFLLIRAMPKEN